MSYVSTNHELARGDLRRALERQRAQQAKPEPLFSLGAVLRALAEGRQPAGFEGEVLRASTSDAGAHGTMFPTVTLPWALVALQRDMAAGSAPSGGYLVQAATKAAAVAFDGSVAAELGVQILPGQTANAFFPRCQAPLAVTWLQTEVSAGAESTPAVGTVAAAPKIAAATVDVSGRLLRAGGPLVDDFLTRLLMQAARAALDTAVFAGTGTAGQPLGLVNDTAIASASGASFNLATATGIQKTVADSLVSDLSAQWVAATDVRQALQQRESFTGAGPLWSGDQLLGRTAWASNRMPAASALYGDFSEVQALLWGNGIEIASDPYTNFQTDITTFRVLLACDVVVPRPGALVRVPSIS